MRALFLLALALFLPPLPAQAASFSCSAAQSPNEIAICSDPVLSATDTTMALAYAGAIAGLTEEAEIVMRPHGRCWPRTSLEAMAGRALSPARSLSAPAPISAVPSSNSPPMT